MRFHLSAPVVTVVILLWSLQTSAKTLDLSVDHDDAIGHYLQVLQEVDTPLSPSDALSALDNGQFRTSPHSVVSLGIGSKPAWLALEVGNGTNETVHRRLLIETSWLDRVEVYFVESGRLVEHFNAGDAVKFSERTIDSRFFSFDHGFSQGTTKVLIRTDLVDPMVLPIYLLSIDDAHDRDLLQGYSYGLLYGAIGSLLAYNLMLFAGLRDDRYLLYSIYLGSFLALNLCYTGHGYQWFWPDSPLWQKWSNPVLMIVYIVCGFLFANRFLDLKTEFPLLHRTLIFGIVGLSGSMALAFVSNHLFLALQLSFAFMVLFPFAMVGLGAISLKSGNRSAKYFFLGSLSAAVGAATTAMAVWGAFHFTTLSYRAVDIGMLFDAVFLAMALAERFRIAQREKSQAEIMAREDPLTNLNNRRAFYELAEPVWHSAQRNQRNICVVLLDIDHFKLINDSYGHAFGDTVLIHIARAMKQELRSYDILARWGGEEFIMLLPETSLEDAIIVADRVRANVENISIGIDLQNVAFSASLGVALNTDPDKTLNELISEADQQLYAAKAQGRNRVCCIFPTTLSSHSGAT